MNKLLLISVLIPFIITSCSELSKSSKNKDETQAKQEESNPKLTKPVVKKTWVEDQIQGERYIEGHWEYIIEENSVWGGK